VTAWFAGIGEDAGEDMLNSFISTSGSLTIHGKNKNCLSSKATRLLRQETRGFPSPLRRELAFSWIGGGLIN